VDLNRYLDLYLSESQDHLGLLSRALLALEQGAGASAIDDAFRAAHTVKGMSATMGFRRCVADRARSRELLDEIRTGSRSVDSAIMDDLLARADSLERAVVASASAMLVRLYNDAPAVAAAEAVDASSAENLAGLRYARVHLKPDTQMKVARALILTRVLVQKSLVTRSEPEQFADDFGGTFALVLAPDADEEAVTNVLSATPEIESFSIEQGQAVVPAEPAKAAEAPAAKAAAKTSFLRVDQRRMDDVAEVLGEVAILQGRMVQLAAAHPGTLQDLANRMTRLISELQHSVLAMRMVPVGDVFDRFPRMVRDAARALGKEVDFHRRGARQSKSTGRFSKKSPIRSSICFATRWTTASSCRRAVQCGQARARDADSARHA
jgi:two-component system chemotaxis sensor kinase CheA